jgi:hypothetical protein
MPEPRGNKFLQNNNIQNEYLNFSAAIEGKPKNKKTGPWPKKNQAGNP